MAAKYSIATIRVPVAVAFLVTSIIAGCNPTIDSSTDVYQSQEFEELIAMHCRARELKEMRFALAEELRENVSKWDVESSDSLKKARAKQSRALGDSIGDLIQLLTAEMSLEEKRAFSDSIESRVVAGNCNR